MFLAIILFHWQSVHGQWLTNDFHHFRVDRNKYQIQIPLPPKIDPSVTMMTVEEKPDVTYNDVGGCKEQIEKMREVSDWKFPSFLISYN